MYLAETEIRQPDISYDRYGTFPTHSRKVAYHEAGHAVVWLCLGTPGPEEVTIRCKVLLGIEVILPTGGTLSVVGDLMAGKSGKRKRRGIKPGP